MENAPRILVVDDDLPILLLMQNLLRQFGFEPVTASSADVALRSAQAAPPDFILLDRNMPDVTGDQLIRLLRADLRLGAVPIFILSGERIPPAEISASGADGAIQKPFDVGELIATIRRTIAQRAPIGN